MKGGLAMRLCFIGKYPPIEGGVSVQSFWTMRGLAERGHHIYTVTNADEVEDAFRIYMRQEDQSMYEPAFPDCGGFVKVRNVEPFRHFRMDHIPTANPFVTKLASVATDIVREHQCDVIFGSYFEPYCMAAALASHWTGVPYVIKHAGSDFDRLMKVPDLATAYREMIRGAKAIITRPHLVDRFVRMGVPLERLRTRTSFSLHPDVFSPDAEPLDADTIDSLAALLPGHERDRRIDLTIPTIGIYGKVGETKGSYDLIKALGALKREGIPFNFLAVTDGWRDERFQALLLEDGIAERTWVLPFLPHWRIPGVIRTCISVCFLERDFPVAIHGPQVPREVLACGGCLILSREIAEKQYQRERMKHGVNLLIVKDPRDINELAGVLRTTLKEPAIARQIGMAGAELSREIQNYSRFVDGYERLFMHISGQLPEGDLVVDRDSNAAEPDDSFAARARQRATPLTYFRCLFPMTSRIVPEPVGTESKQPSTPDANPLEDVYQLVNEVKGRLQQADSGRPEYLAEVFRYETFMLSLAAEDEFSPHFPCVDRFRGRKFTLEAIQELHPLKGRHAIVRDFEYDITQLARDLATEDTAAIVARKPTTLLMQCSSNKATSCFRVNVFTRDLLERCDGSQTVGAILADFARISRIDLASDGTQFREALLGALRELYRKGVIIFT